MNQIARLLIESAEGAQQSEKAAFDLRKLVGNFRLPTEKPGALAGQTSSAGYFPQDTSSDSKSFAASAR